MVQSRESSSGNCSDIYEVKRQLYEQSVVLKLFAAFPFLYDAAEKWRFKKADLKPWTTLDITVVYHK